MAGCRWRLWGDGLKGLESHFCMALSLHGKELLCLFHVGACHCVELGPNRQMLGLASWQISLYYCANTIHQVYKGNRTGRGRNSKPTWPRTYCTLVRILIAVNTSSWTQQTLSVEEAFISQYLLPEYTSCCGTPVSASDVLAGGNIPGRCTARHAKAFPKRTSTVGLVERKASQIGSSN